MAEPKKDPKKIAAEVKKGRSGGITGGIWWAFAAVGAFYLVTDRREHVWDYLPYLMLVSSPLLDIFRRYSGHRRGDLVRPAAKPPWE